MGFVRVKGKIIGRRRGVKGVEVEFIADTGAMWTVLPASILAGLGYKPTEQRKFKVANGKVHAFPVGEARLEIEGKPVTATVVFGPEEGAALLGVTTLEEFGVEVDSITGKLRPMELLLLASSTACRNTSPEARAN